MSAPLKPFVIFAQPRTGSTTLLRVLQLHPQLHISEEPFYEKYHEWHPDEPNYVDLIEDIPTLEEQLTALFSRYDGIKVLSYQLPEEIYAHMLLKPELRVIALSRRNLLQQEVSGFIAKQTGIWQMSDLKGDLGCAYKDLKPVDLAELKRHMEYVAHLYRYYSDVLSRKPRDMYLQLEYEKFYTADAARNRESIQTVFQFLGLDAPRTTELDDLLNPSVSKINTPGTYAFLPNAKEIDRELGSDETGWLLGKTEDAEQALGADAEDHAAQG